MAQFRQINNSTDVSYILFLPTEILMGYVHQIQENRNYPFKHAEHTLDSATIIITTTSKQN